MPPAVPLTQFLAAGGGKTSWADEEGDASAPAALPSYSRAPSYASAQPQHATKTIPTVGPFVVFVGNVSYDIEQARPACAVSALPRKPSRRMRTRCRARIAPRAGARRDDAGELTRRAPPFTQSDLETAFADCGVRAPCGPCPLTAIRPRCRCGAAARAAG